jgi:hypothetical protein
MSTQHKTLADLNLGKGIKILSPELAELADIDLGPLSGLVGEWANIVQIAGAEPNGWNLISVPGPPPEGFVLEVIPYTERLTFTPVVVAGNRGLFKDGTENVQQINGLLYEQIIHSACTTEECKKRGFPLGSEIHAERGLFLLTPNPSVQTDPITPAEFDIARLSVIPHGNSLLAPGKSAISSQPNNDFIPSNSSLPTPVFGKHQFEKQQFPGVFDQLNPNSFLTNTLGLEKVSSLTTLEFNTANGTGGILNIPFIHQNVNAAALSATFYIETITNPTPGQPDILQLQYSQTITLEFAPTVKPGEKKKWPHITINTLRKLPKSK